MRVIQLDGQYAQTVLRHLDEPFQGLAPVLANRSDIASEVLGEHGLYFDGTPEGLTEALLALEDSDTQADLRARLASFNWPAWEQVVPALFTALIADAQGEAPLPPVIAPR